MSINTDISASEDLLGKVIGDLQSNIAVGSNYITGELNYVTDYTGFSGDTSLQSGNYLALHCEVPQDAEATITAELIGGTYGPVTLDEDGIIVFRVANNNQKVKITASKTGYESVTKIFNLSNIELDRG